RRARGRHRAGRRRAGPAPARMLHRGPGRTGRIRGSGRAMKPAPFVYHRPESVENATRLLAELGDEAKVVAGGQSLVPLLNFRLAAPAPLVDVNGIAGLDWLDPADGAVDVGATVRHSRLLREPEVAAAHPLLVEATAWIAHPVIRNRG